MNLKDKDKIPLLFAICALVIALIALGSQLLTTHNQNPTTLPTTEAVTAIAATKEASAKECEHDWTITYKSVHHDAVTHTETVAPVYANKTEYHTVCNDCEQVIDGIADQHIKDTGHSGYSTNVPITKEVLISEGYTQEITDQAAYDETVADKLVCTKCGAERAVSTTEATQE